MPGLAVRASSKARPKPEFVEVYVNFGTWVLPDVKLFAVVADNKNKR
jgi:hypothetical protein